MPKLMDFRLTVLFFNLGSLDILNEIDRISEVSYSSCLILIIVIVQQRQQLVNWIYSLQITTAEGMWIDDLYVVLLLLSNEIVMSVDWTGQIRWTLYL